MRAATVPTKRRWSVGDTEVVAGLRFRVVAGNRCEGDLWLEWFVAGEWVPVRGEELLAFLADFLYENEDVRCPPPQKGGAYVVDRVRWAGKVGWRTPMPVQERML